MPGTDCRSDKSRDVLTWATSIVFGIFVLLAITLNLMTYTKPVEKTDTAAGAPPKNSTPVER